VNAIPYLASTGCQWWALPKAFPPVSPVQCYFCRWAQDGMWRKNSHVLVMLSRERAGREASPTAGVIDSQSVKSTLSGGPHGFDAGKKIKGRKRHIFADGGYAGDKLKGDLAELGHWIVEIVRRSDTAKGFVLLPRR